METLDDLKAKWMGNRTIHQSYNKTTMNEIVKTRVSKHKRTAMHYFWTSFVFQILIYALLAHVGIRYWNDLGISLLASAGILLYVPFTKTLMQKFKGMATFPSSGPGTTIRDYVIGQRSLLESFFTFKKRYELFLIPLSCAIGVLLTFTLYVPGGVMAYPQGASLVFGISLVSCYVAIRKENIRNFKLPIIGLNEILKELTMNNDQ